MRNFFRLHDYSENMKGKIATFSVKGKVDIWWENVKNIIGIHEEYVTWNEFARLFKKKYLSERYFDDREKEFYLVKMGSMIDEEYTRFLELLRHVHYLKEEKVRIQRLISGLLISFKDRIKFNEPISLEESILKLKHFYEQSKCRYQTKID